MIAAAIGNGPVRQGFDLETLRDKVDLIVGCNDIYKEFIPDIIASLDFIQTEAISKIGLGDRKWKWLTRGYKIRTGTPILYLMMDGKPICPMGEVNGGQYNNSGLLACAYLAQIMKAKKIYLVGYDFGRLRDDRTEKLPVLYKVFNKLVESCPGTEFIRVGPIHPDETMFYHTRLKGMKYIDNGDLV